MSNVVELHRPAPAPKPRHPAVRMVGISEETFDHLTKWLAIPDMPAAMRLEFINNWRKNNGFEPLTRVASLRESGYQI